MKGTSLYASRGVVTSMHTDLSLGVQKTSHAHDEFQYTQVKGIALKMGSAIEYSVGDHLNK